MSGIVRVLVVAIALVFSHSLLAGSTVYEVSKGKQKIYLAGTIHLLRPQDFPLPAEYNEAYKRAQKIYFETDIEKAKDPAFAQRFAQAMLLPDNKTVKDILSAKNWAALQEYANKTQYPLSQTMMYNPAMLSFLITLAETNRLGAGEGVDAFFDKAARADRKYIGELESADEVIVYMQKLGQEDPDKLIESLLGDIENMPVDLEKMISHWRKGELNDLDQYFSERMRRETPIVYQSLMVARNQKWLPKIEEMFKTPEVELVLVGSLHLSGKDGLLVYLKESGYAVKPFQLQK